MSVRVLTIVTPAASAAFVTLAAFKTELQITGRGDDPYIQSILAQASAAAARYCRRGFAVETVAETIYPDQDPYPFQVPPAPGPLQLSRWPVVATASLVADGVSLVEGIDVRTDIATGLVYRLDARGRPTAWSADSIVATYSAGYESVPADLADAVTRLAKARWFARQRDPGVRSETIPGVHDASYWFASGPGAADGLPPDVAGLLDQFRMPVTA